MNVPCLKVVGPLGGYVELCCVENLNMRSKLIYRGYSCIILSTLERSTVCTLFGFALPTLAKVTKTNVGTICK